MNRNLNFINASILFLLLFYLVIDTITGYCLNIGINFSLSIAYKMLILILMFFETSIINVNFLLIYLPIIIFFIFSYMFYLFNGYTNNIFGLFQDYIKIFSCIFFYNYFNTLDKKYYYYIEKIIYINFLVFMSNIIVGILGFGFPTYDYGLGIKGFFYAGNEIFLIILSIFVIYIRKTEKKDKNILIAFVIISTILIGTKSAFIAAILIVIYDKYKYANMKNRVQYFIFLIIFFILLFCFFYNYILQISTINSAIYNIQKGLNNSDKNIMDVFLSGRIGFLEANISEWKKTYSINQLLFGGSNFHNMKTNEIDFFDTIMQHGVIITGFITIFYFYLFFRALISKKYTLAFFNLLIIIISQLAGHVWANLSGGIFFILANTFEFTFVMKKKVLL